MLEDMDALFAQSTVKSVIAQLRGQQIGGGSAAANQLKKEKEKDISVVEVEGR